MDWAILLQARANFKLCTRIIGISKQIACIRLANRRPDQVDVIEASVCFFYSSPLLRPVKTASAISRRCGLAVQIHDGLADIDYTRPASPAAKC